MSPLKSVFCFLLTITILAGCQPKKNPKQRLGRGGRGYFNSAYNSNPSIMNAGANQCGSYIPAGANMTNKMWGEVTSTYGDQQFMQELYLLTAPVLSSLPAEDQLGQVSGQSGQYTGVRFWGNARTYYPGMNGQIDISSLQVRIEIYDDKACQPKSDGTVRPMIPIDIGPSQPGFVRGQGAVSNGQANIYVEDIYGAISLQGVINGQYFTGTMSYSTPQTGGQLRQLGTFNVPTCGFFQCN